MVTSLNVSTASLRSPQHEVEHTRHADKGGWCGERAVNAWRQSLTQINSLHVCVCVRLATRQIYIARLPTNLLPVELSNNGDAFV